MVIWRCPLETGLDFHVMQYRIATLPPSPSQKIASGSISCKCDVGSEDSDDSESPQTLDDSDDSENQLGRSVYL